LKFRQSDQIFSHTDFFRSKDQRFDIVCLQETGLLADPSEIPSDLLNKYTLYTNYERKIIHKKRRPNYSTAILLSPRIQKYFLESIEHPSGRATAVTFQFQSSTLCVINVYFPSGLQSSGKTINTSSPKYLTGVEICDFVSELQNKHTHTIVCGDFNECHNDERNPVGKFPPPQFLPRLVSETLEDCSREIDSHTHFYRCRFIGEHRSSKLDRFLFSGDLASLVTSYNILTTAPFQSPHRPVSVQFAVFDMDTTKFENFPTPDFFHKHITVYDRSHSSISNLCHDLDSKLDLSEIPDRFDESDRLQSAFEHVSDTIRTIVRSHTKTTRTSGFKHSFDRTVTQTRADLRSLIFMIKNFLVSNPTPTLSDFRSQFPSQRRYTCERTASQHGFFLPSSSLPRWQKTLESVQRYCRVLKQRIRSNTRQQMQTLRQRRDHTYRNDRSQFYTRYIDGHTPATYPTRIYDSESDEVVSDPHKLAATLTREASSLLANPLPEPPDPPEWIKTMYRFNAKGVDPSIWSNLMSDFTPAEVLEAVSEKDTSPGASGITRLVLHLIMSPQYRDKASPNVTLEYITSLLNAFLRSEISCEYTSIGLLVLIPKPGKHCSLRYRDKRPLTMINELPKIAHSILGKRICVILTEYALLHPANRAYLRGASTYDCNRLLIDRIEQAIRDGHPLLAIFYDFSKAFDRLQWWHIRWALRRFAMPDSFINFLFSYLKCARTHIRTRYGLTDGIDILTSARQGDPLSQYIWQICIESLHDLLNEDPYNYSISSFPFAYSLGYSDDTGILTSDTTRLRTRHNQVKEFARWHCMVLNDSKTECIAINISDAERNNLAHHDFAITNTQLCFHEDHVWYYLGLQHSTTLDWSHHLDRLETSFIIPTATKIRHRSFTLDQICSIYREKIISRIGYTAQFFLIPPSYTRRWDSIIYQAIRHAFPHVYRSVSKAGVYHLLRLQTITDYAPIVSLSEMMIRLNTDSLCAQLERSRVREYVQLDGTLLPRGNDTSTHGRILNYWIRRGVRVSLNLQSYHFQNNFTPMFYNTSSPWNSIPYEASDVVEAYTDASTTPGESTSGVSSVIFHHSNLDSPSPRYHVATHKVETGGINFLGEALSVIQLCETTPLQIHVHSDCERFVRGTERFLHQTPRQRLRTPYRCIFQHFYRMCEARDTPVDLTHVRAHTNRTDQHSNGNRMANSHARSARSLVSVTTPNLLAGEERYVLYDRDALVVDDHRKHLLRISRTDQFHAWTENKWQGSVARHVSPTFSFSRKISPFSINLLTRTLPIGRLITHIHHTGSACPFCSFNVVDDVRHFFCCAATTFSVQLSERLICSGQHYGHHTSALAYIRTHLTNDSLGNVSDLLHTLQNLFLVTSHHLNNPASPFTFRMCTTGLPKMTKQSPDIFALCTELQQTFSCTYQICASPLDLLPHTYRWELFMSKTPSELSGFCFLEQSDFAGSLICTFPLDPTKTTHTNLLKRFIQFSLSRKPSRFVFFMNANIHIPLSLQPYHITGDLTRYNFFVIENKSGRKFFHVNLRSYFSRFHKHYPVSKSILPPPRSLDTHVKHLDRLSHLFWLPEIGLRTTVPPTLSMAQEDPAKYLQRPLELRLLGKTDPRSPLTFNNHPIFRSLQPFLITQYNLVYHRRQKLWRQYVSLMNPKSPPPSREKGH